MRGGGERRGERDRERGCEGEEERRRDGEESGREADRAGWRQTGEREKQVIFPPPRVPRLLYTQYSPYTDLRRNDWRLAMVLIPVFLSPHQS